MVDGRSPWEEEGCYIATVCAEIQQLRIEHVNVELLH